MQSKHFLKRLALSLSLALPGLSGVKAEPLNVGQKAPVFDLKDQNGNAVRLEDRRGKGWTVLYFYPKAGTPGCTTQACAFRDALKSVTDLNAVVYGVSTDEVAALLSFHEKYRLNFTLLSDPDAKTTEAYGVKMPVVNMAKRWTFIIDPELTVRDINDQVDPALDAKTVALRLKQLGATASPTP